MLVEGARLDPIVVVGPDERAEQGDEARDAEPARRDEESGEGSVRLRRSRSTHERTFPMSIG